MISQHVLVFFREMGNTLHRTLLLLLLAASTTDSSSSSSSSFSVYFSTAGFLHDSDSNPTVAAAGQCALTHSLVLGGAVCMPMIKTIATVL